jgi:cysteine desulfurase
MLVHWALLPAVMVVGLLVMAQLFSTSNTRQVVATAGTATGTALIYLDNNATTHIYPEALEAMVAAYSRCFANPSALLYKCGREARNRLYHCRRRIMALLNCPEHSMIIFTSGATEANNAAIGGAVLQGRNAARHHVLCSPIEHASVSRAVEHHSRGDVEWLPVDRHGMVCLQALQRSIRTETALVTVLMASNEVGTIQDVSQISRLCRTAAVHYHCDITQMVGKYVLDLDSLGMDSAAFSAHKFGGPRGVGFLYIRDKRNLPPPCLYGGGQEHGVRSGTENVPAIVGATTALEKSHAILRTYDGGSGGGAHRVRALRDFLATQITTQVPECEVMGHPTQCLYNTLAISLPVNSRIVMSILDSHGICVSSGSACTKGSDSPTLEAMGFDVKAREGSMRVSLWFDTTMADCVRFMQVLPLAVRHVQLGAGDGRLERAEPNI